MSQIGATTLHGVPLSREAGYFTVVAEAPASPESAVEAAYRQLGQTLAREGMEVLHERIFGSLNASAEVLAAREAALSAYGLDIQTPATYVEGCPAWGDGFAGASVMAVRPSGAQGLTRVADAAGRICGRTWQTHGAAFTFLQSLHGRTDCAQDDNGRSAQTGRMFDLAEQVLEKQGTSYRSVTRTWLYVSDILDWYGELNRVRSSRYEVFGLMPKPGAHSGNGILLPASTGIEGNGATGAAVTMDLLATVLGPQSRVEIKQMTNPRQKDAFAYGSAFSRAVAIRMPEAAWISFSGTAAIDRAGLSCFPGDFRAQMNMTLDLVETLIAQEGARLSDICNATLFMKSGGFATECRQVLCERGLGAMPGVAVVADICRDELLFEMDGMAAVPR